MNCEDWDAHPEYKTYLEKLFSDPKAVQKEHAEFYNLLINTLGQDGNRKIENFLDSSLFAYDKISKGIDAVNVYSNVVEWVSDCVKYDSLAKAFVDTNNEYKAVLYEAVNYMETEDVWYGMQYKAALEKYAAYMNDDKMVEVFLDYCLTNGATRIADVFGGAIETGIVSYFTEALGLTPQAASYIFAAIEAYKVGWSIGDAITHNGDVIDCRELIRANYHLEYAIGKLTNHYESELNKQQTYNTAVYFDEAYSILQVTEVFSMKTYVKYLVAQETSWVQGICHGANWCYNEAEIWNVLAGDLLSGKQRFVMKKEYSCYIYNSICF